VKPRKPSHLPPTPEEYSFEIKHFPTTRFQGSKRKLVHWIYATIGTLDFHSALDAFGGTGTVSYLLKRMGKQVTYNDILKSHCLSAYAFIENNTARLTTDEINSLCWYRRATAKKGFVSKTYKDYYFTEAENLWLDYILQQLSMDFNVSLIGFYKKAVIYHALFQTLLCKRPFNMFHRKNLYLRTARVSRSFGNKTTWEKPIRSLFRHFLEEANQRIFTGASQCAVTNHDVRTLTNVNYDLVYIDPPYLSRYGHNETADYRAIYHFLEGMAHGARWPQMVDYTSPIKSLQTSSTNPWITKHLNQKAFDSLFEQFARSIIVVSYKSNGIPSIATLIRMLKRHGRRPRTVSRPHTYALRKPDTESIPNREYLIISP
jgi:adenine-specific DNA methylase